MIERTHDTQEFPTDLPDDGDPADAFRWTVAVIATTAALLALTNAGAISGWAASFDPKPAVLPLVRAADHWDQTTARLGLATPHASMHRAWKRAEAARWSEAQAKQ